MSQNHDMITTDTVVESSKSFDHLGFFNVPLNLSTLASTIFTSIKNAAAVARTVGFAVFKQKHHN